MYHPNPYRAGSDEHYMRECITLAQRGLGWTSPNPGVGALIVREGEVLGQGWHHALGERHAETEAMAAAALCFGADALRGASCYTSLEPCSHVGLQPSCCHELAAAGIARVVFGCRDGDLRSAGRAEHVLQGLGIACVGAVLEEECAALLEHYLHEREQGRLFAHLKLALSLDAKLACANGASQWLSGPQSHGLAHYLRQKYDAVLVGSGTVLADNPRLTVRADVLDAYWPSADLRLRHPARVILDPRFELLPRLLDAGAELAAAIPPDERRAGLPWLIIAGQEGRAPKHGSPAPGVELLGLGVDQRGRLDLSSLHTRLHTLGIRSLLIEGGSAVAREYIAQRAVSKLTLVYTPRIIGAEGLGFSPELGAASLDQTLRLNHVSTECLGQDLALSATPVWGEG